MSSFLKRGNGKKRDTAGGQSMFEIEEFNTSPESLKEVLADRKVLRSFFRQFLMQRMAVESLLFYETIEIYENLNSPEHRTKAGQGMIQRFIVEDSQYQVNVSADLRNSLVNTKEFTESTFQVAKDEIYNLLSTNFFESFLKELQTQSHGDSGAVKPSFSSAPGSPCPVRKFRTESNVSNPFHEEKEQQKPRVSRMSSLHFFKKRKSQGRSMTFWEDIVGEGFDLPVDV